MNNTIKKIAFAYEDVLLVPGFSECLPSDVSVKTQMSEQIKLSVPIMSSAMDTVTESKLAIAMAQAGGIGTIHKNMSISEQAEEIRHVKRFESGVVTDPVTIAPNAPLAEALALMQSHNFSGMPVIDPSNNQLISADIGLHALKY